MWIYIVALVVFMYALFSTIYSPFEYYVST